MDDESVKTSLAALLPEPAFKIDDRTVAITLKELERYCSEIPFGDKNWRDFWFPLGEDGASGVDRLVEVHEDKLASRGELPVQQAFLLCLLNLLESPKALLNSIPERHRMLYYRDGLGLRPRRHKPDRIVVSFTLNDELASRTLRKGTLLDAGFDRAGNPLHYALDRDTVLSHQTLNSLCWALSSAESIGKNADKLHFVLDDRRKVNIPDGGCRLFDAMEFCETLVPEIGPAMFIGISLIDTGETLSMHWDIEAAAPLLMKLYYFNGETWRPLDGFVADSTSGLQTVGWWEVRLPTDMIRGSDIHQLDKSCYWIKAEPISTGAIFEEMPLLKGLYCNSSTATLASSDVDESHFQAPLPAGTVRGLVSPGLASITVSQKGPSTGGKMSETTEAFIKRSASRIGHRQRAITPENMRSMLLDNFPEVLDVIVTEPEKVLSLPAPQTQNLTVLTSQRYSEISDPLRPELNLEKLRHMALSLSPFMSQWVGVRLENPRYTNMIITLDVLFQPSIPSTYGYQQLLVTLQDHYMPWATNKYKAVSPGKKMEYHTLLSVLQRSPLVERVLQLSINREGQTHLLSQNDIEVQSNEVIILTEIKKWPNTTAESDQ